MHFLRHSFFEIHSNGDFLIDGHQDYRLGKPVQGR
jgi:hypothetical protein